MKNVLILIPSLTAGGAERQVVADANLLNKAGFEIGIAYNVEGPLLQQIDQSVKKHYLGRGPILQASFRLNSIIKKHKYEIVFAHMFWSQKIAFSPTIINRSELILFEHGLGLWRKWYHSLIANIISINAKKVITCSEESKRYRNKRDKITLKKLVTMPNSFIPLPVDAQINSKRNDRFIIGFAGRFNKVKQLHLLIDIALELKSRKTDFLFVLMGNGSEWNVIEDLINKNSLNDHFQLTGYVSNPEERLQEMDAFVLPSRVEDFSLALLEASSAQLPCLAFDVGGNKEIIQDGETGYLIKPYDIMEFADKLEYLINNRDFSKKLGNEARVYVNREFNESKRLERLNKILSNY